MNLQKIMVPIDFSELSGKALQSALEMARKEKGQVILVHVFDRVLFEYGAMYGEGIPVLAEQFRDDDEEMHAKLRSLVPAGTADGVDVVTRVFRGDPHDVLVEIAEQEGVDLIVMGTHGRRGISHLFLGSVAEKVVRLAPCPVLTMKGTKAGAKQEVA